MLEPVLGEGGWSGVSQDFRELCQAIPTAMAQEMKWDSALYDDRHSFVWKLAVGLLDLLNAQPGEKKCNDRQNEYDSDHSQ
jgi:hypothetical protein